MSGLTNEEKEELLGLLKAENVKLKKQIKEQETQLKKFSKAEGSTTEGFSEPGIALYQDGNGDFQLTQLVLNPETQEAKISKVSNEGKDFHMAAHKAREFFEMNVMLRR